MDLKARDLAAAIPADHLSRGRHYYQQGQVLRVDVEQDFIAATVQGSRGMVYACDIFLSRDRRQRLQVDGACDCPVGFNCKHVAAALLAVVGRQENTRADAVDEHAQRWLNSVDAALTDPDAYPPEVRDRLLYLLDTRRDHTGVAQFVVTPMRVRLLKDGRYGAASAYRANPYGVARFVRPVDLRLLRELEWLQDSPYSGEQHAWGQLLPAVLATGRCHWQDKDSPPLSAGPPRFGHFEWHTEADGGQQLRLRLDQPAEVLPTLPLWYVDSEAAVAGPIRTELPDRLAAALAASPVLSPAAAEEASLRLQALPLPRPLPLPAQLKRIERTDVAPAVCLYLLGTGRDRAELSFDYDGLRASPAQPAPRLSGRRGGELWLIERDQAFEATAVARLHQLGLHADPAEPQIFACEDASAWVAFMREGLPALQQAGWRITVADEFGYRLAEVEDWYAELDEQSNDWFGLGLGVLVDGARINLLPLLSQLIRQLPATMAPTELAALPDETELYARLDDGRLLPLPVARVRPILTTLLELYEPGTLEDGQLRLSRLQGTQLAALAEQVPMAWAGGGELRELGERLRNFRGITPVTPPTGLNATLRPYQQQGLNWLQFLREFGFGGVLADDMGLGKTLQTLAHLLAEKEAGRADRPSLVVCPTSLIPNWRREAARFAPGLKVLTLHGPGRQQRFAAIAEHDLVLTTYPLLPRDLEALAAHEYHLLVLDEAQHIKNPLAKAAAAARTLSARQRLCLSGTPLENHLGELWSLFHFLMPGLLGSRERFARLFRQPIEKHGDPVRSTQLRERVAPFLLRRTKDAVAAELPPKTEAIRSVVLEGAQRDLYETVRLALHERIRAEVAARGWEGSQIVVLDALLKLRQVCCDPRLAKLEGARRVKQSAKLALLLEMLPALIEEGRRVLLFSQFTGMLGLIEEALAPLRIPYVKLTGQTRDRQTPVERFQAGEVPLFLISLKAGGTGLNLTAADTVIHYDPWWNPAVERQATDRAHRIGQDKPVLVYKLICEGTVEEKMTALQAHKQALADGVLEAGGGGELQLTAADLEVLFEPLA